MSAPNTIRGKVSNLAHDSQRGFRVIHAATYPPYTMRRASMPLPDCTDDRLRIDGMKSASEPLDRALGRDGSAPASNLKHSRVKSGAIDKPQQNQPPEQPPQKRTIGTPLVPHDPGVIYTLTLSAERVGSGSASSANSNPVTNDRVPQHDRARPSAATHSTSHTTAPETSEVQQQCREDLEPRSPTSSISSDMSDWEYIL